MSPNKSIKEGRFLLFEAVIGYLSSNQLARANKKKSRAQAPMAIEHLECFVDSYMSNTLT